jgi:hypothetical protein
MFCYSLSVLRIFWVHDRDWILLHERLETILLDIYFDSLLYYHVTCHILHRGNTNLFTNEKIRNCSKGFE